MNTIKEPKTLEPILIVKIWTNYHAYRACTNVDKKLDMRIGCRFWKSVNFELFPTLNVLLDLDPTI